MSKVDLRLQCGMPCSKLEVSTVQRGTLSGAGYLHQSPFLRDMRLSRQGAGIPRFPRGQCNRPGRGPADWFSPLPGLGRRRARFGDAHQYCRPHEHARRNRFRLSLALDETQGIASGWVDVKIARPPKSDQLVLDGPEIASRAYFWLHPNRD